MQPIKKRKRASHFDTCMRWWAKTTYGKIIRGLWVDRYDENGNERCYVRILNNKDQRPKGVHLHGQSASFNDVLAGFPVNEWIELRFS